MATIPISDGTPRDPYTAAAGQTIFPYTFWIREGAHLAVYVNGVRKTITTDYTISAVQSPTGANVVFNSGLVEDDEVVLVYDPEIERESEYTGTIRLTALNTELSYITTILQNNKRLVDGSIKVSDSDTAAFSGTLPTLTGNGGRVLGLKSDLSGVEFLTISSADVVVSNYEEGSFDGDNLETTFTLPFTPNSQNGLLVWVDDVRQRPGTDYTTTGTTLTFTTAPASGTANITYLNTAAATSVNTPADGSVTTMKLQDLAVTSAKLAANAVTTAKVADNSITLAKLEHATQGDILYYGASGVPARLGAGSAGQVLQSGGAGADPSWSSVSSFAASDITSQTDAAIALDDQVVYSDTSDSGNLKKDTIQGIVDASGGWAFVSNGTISEDDTTIDFPFATSGYDYRVILYWEQKTATTSFSLNVTDDNFSSIESGASDYSYQRLYSGVAESSTGTSAYRPATTFSWKTSENNYMQITALDPQGSEVRPILTESMITNTGNQPIIGSSVGQYQTAAAYNGIRFTAGAVMQGGSYKLLRRTV